MNDRVGQQIGNYRLIQLLGQGTYAEVWLAEHRNSRRQVAIKILRARLEGKTIQAFLNEARSTFLRHPHIIEIIDFGVEYETGYLVMPHAARGSLRAAYPAGQRVPMETVAVYVQQISQALAHAHAAGIIHRDIKPENMLIGPNGEILLSDFGVAVQLHTDNTYTHRPTAGTPFYIAPEQFDEQSHFASDQYSLAIVIYEWLSGSKPFEGNLLQLMKKHKEERPPSLRSRVPDLSPAVEEVIMRGLEKDPRARYPSIEAFAAAFEQAVKRPLTKADIIARLRASQQATQVLQDEQFQQQFIEFIAQDPIWWRSEALPALQTLHMQAGRSPGSTIPASLKALAAKAAQKLSEALLAQQEQLAAPLLGMLSLGAPPASAPDIWRELLRSLAPIQPVTISWELRSWLLQQWGRLTPLPDAEQIRPWMNVLWKEVDQLVRLKLPAVWYQKTIEALLMETFVAGSLEIVERQKEMFQTALSGMLQNDWQWAQVRGFFARLIQLGYRLKLELLGSLLSVPTLDAPKAEALWRSAALSQQERETFFKNYFPFLPGSLPPAVKAFLEEEQRKLREALIKAKEEDLLTTQPERVNISLSPPTSTVIQAPRYLGVSGEQLPKSRREWLLEGNAQYQKQDYQRALECYEQAIQLEPNHANSYQSKGNALRGLGQASSALAAYERAIGLSPKQAMYHAGKGWALVDLHEYDKALQAFEEALNCSPRLLYAHIGKGTAYGELGDHQKSLEAFERAIELDVTFALAYRGKSRALFSLGRNEEAEQAAKRARELGDSW